MFYRNNKKSRKSIVTAAIILIVMTVLCVFQVSATGVQKQPKKVKVGYYETRFSRRAPVRIPQGKATRMNTI